LLLLGGYRQIRQIECSHLLPLQLTNFYIENLNSYLRLTSWYDCKRNLSAKLSLLFDGPSAQADADLSLEASRVGVSRLLRENDL